MAMETQRLGTKSPIHVHVARNTPVHVHVKKPGKNSSQREVPGVPTAVETRLSQRTSSGLSTGKSANRRPKSKPRATPTFIPPPGKTSSGGKSLAWQGPRHRLEISQPEFSPRKKSHGPLQRLELSTSEDEDLAGKENVYEHRINSLLEEVGTLRNEMSLKKSARVLEKKEEQLNASRRILEEQEDELLGYKSELDTTIMENEKLRHSMEKYKDIMAQSRNEVENIETEKEALLRKLVEVEVDGKAAAEQVGKLRDAVRRLKHDKKITASDASALAHQREVLMQKLEEFETTNRTLRKLLKHAHLKEDQTNHMAEQRDVLLRKLTEAESRVEELTIEVSDKNRKVETLLDQVEGDKEQARTFQELKRTMEATRGHLQNQLRSKEGENNRMSLQLREIEQELNRRIVEIEHLEGLLSSTREKATKDKEALKKATRIHRDRAHKNEDAVETVRSKLTTKEGEVETLKTELEAYKNRYANSRSRLQEIEQVIAAVDPGSSKGTGESLSSVLQSKLQEINIYKDQVTTLTERLKSAASKAAEMTRENDELNEKIYQKEKEMKKLLHQSQSESEKTINKFEKRIVEMEAYPELLKASELRLQDAQDRIKSYEQRATEHTRLIAELTQKADSQAEQLERVREKYQDKHDGLKQLQARLEIAERKLEDSEMYKKEIMHTVSKREDSIHVMQERLDEQRNENSRLMQQLETALADARRQSEVQKEKALSKERTAQARILDLEAQLSKSAATAQQLKRTKDEAERKFNSRLQDMRDRLEQANSTTRSMQNYVSFLKSTYTSVFNDERDSPILSPRPY